MDLARDIRLAQQGDDAAFGRLCARYRNLLLYRTHPEHVYAPGLTRDDFLQEARFGLWKAVRDFRPGAKVPFPAFAKLCVDRQVITTIKAAKRGKHSPLNEAKPFVVADEEDGEGASFEPVDPVTPEDRFAVREAVGEALRAIQWLSALERVALIRVGINGESYKTLATETGESVKTIDNALQRARRKIGAMLPSTVCEICREPSEARRCAACDEEIEFARQFLEAA